MKHWSWGLLLTLVSGVAFAASPGKAPVELSMLLTGSVVIAPDGHVQGYTLDQAEKLSPAIRAFMDKSVSAWTFHPVEVDGMPVTAKSKMNVRLVAATGENDSFSVRVRAASFGGGDPGDSLTYKRNVRRVAPEYPESALRARAGGTVYLLVKVGRDGRVQDAAAQQVNLTESGPAHVMASLRKAFADTSVHAARRWTFDPPTGGPGANDPWWVARIPVTFAIGRDHRPQDERGYWRAYVPGPVEIVPWMDARELAGDAIDTVPDDHVQLLGHNPTLAPSGAPRS